MTFLFEYLPELPEVFFLFVFSPGIVYFKMRKSNTFSISIWTSDLRVSYLINFAQLYKFSI